MNKHQTGLIDPEGDDVDSTVLCCVLSGDLVRVIQAWQLQLISTQAGLIFFILIPKASLRTAKNILIITRNNTDGNLFATALTSSHAVNFK